MMRRVTAALLAAILLALSLCGCSDSSGFSDDEKISAKYSRDKDNVATTFNYVDGAEEPPSSYNNFSVSAGSYALKLFGSYSAEKKSFAFSPMSTVLQLSMLANAAGKDRRTEIIRALGNGTMTLDTLNECSSYFKSRMENVSKLSPEESDWEKAELGGAMLVDESVEVKAMFLQTVCDFFGYDVFRYDLDGDDAGDKLNDYLEDYTDDSGISLPKGSTLNTVSESEIKDGWVIKYADSDVSEGSFKGDCGERKTDFLCSNEYKIGSEKAVGIVKYTSKNPLKLVLITPKDAKSFDDYLKGFDREELSTLLGSIDITKKTTALIPEFSIENDGKARPLSDALKKNGLDKIFSDESGFSSLSYTTKASLGEMYEIPPKFSLSRSGINADDGDEAEKSSVVKTDDTVTFDHPFIFMLIDNESDLPVTMGVYR